MVRIKKAVTKAKEMTVSDLLYISQFKDFYQSLSTGKILIQPTCLADKTKFPLFEVDLRQIHLSEGKTMLQVLTDISDNFSGNYEHDIAVQEVKNFIANYRKSKVRKQLTDVYNRFAIVFNLELATGDESFNEMKSKLDFLFYNIKQNDCNSLKKLRQWFENTNKSRLEIGKEVIPFFEEYDITTDREGNIVFNEVIMNAANLY
jgi:hypothetical protein